MRTFKRELKQGEWLKMHKWAKFIKDVKTNPFTAKYPCLNEEEMNDAEANFAEIKYKYPQRASVPEIIKACKGSFTLYHITKMVESHNLFRLTFLIRNILRYDMNRVYNQDCIDNYRTINKCFEIIQEVFERNYYNNEEFLSMFANCFKRVIMFTDDTFNEPIMAGIEWDSEKGKFVIKSYPFGSGYGRISRNDRKCINLLRYCCEENKRVYIPRLFFLFSYNKYLNVS